MKTTPLAILTVLTLAGGCVTPPEHADPKVHGPRGGIAFRVEVETRPPGARIEVNDDFVGISPTNIVVWGDADGSFHNMGQRYCVVRAYPTGEGQYVQTKNFATGWRGQEDLIPKHIFFDLTVPQENNPNPNYLAPSATRTNAASAK